MKRFLYSVVLAAAGVHAAHAQNQVYLCRGADGSSEYKNTGATKGCTKLDLPGTEASMPTPARRTPDKGNSAAGRNLSTARSSDRQWILQDELNAEESKLVNLKKEFNGGEPERRGDERNYAKYQERVVGMKNDIARTERNIEALKRELRTAR